MVVEPLQDFRLMTHLDLFSGIGGFALAARWVGGIETIGFCEIEDYACQTLERNFPGIPIFRDVRKLHPDDIISRDGRIDFITCGFPCQDLSIAGNQRGIEAERSGLFFEITRLSDEILAYCGVRPALCLENVPNLLAGDGGDWARAVYGELAVRGYCVEWKIVSAGDVGAPHLRKRWWCLAYMADARHSESPRWNEVEERQQSGRGRKAWSESTSCSFVADTNEQGLEGSTGQGIQGRVYGSSGGCEDVAHTNSLGHRGRSDQKRGNGERIFQQEEQGWSEMGGEAQGCGKSCGEDVADTNRKGMEGGKDTGGSCENWKKSYDQYSFRCNKTLPDSNRNGFDQRRKSVTKTGSNGSFRNPGGSTERGLGGMVDGIPDWVDEPGDIPRVTRGQKNRVARLKGLGNAVVPQCAMIPLMRLKEIYQEAL